MINGCLMQISISLSVNLLAVGGRNKNVSAKAGGAIRAVCGAIPKSN